MINFEFRTTKAKQLYHELGDALDGSENCVDNRSDLSLEDSPTDLFTENWNNRGISKEVAEELCAGCHVYEKCAAYAIEQQEQYFVWGGTRPIDRGVKPKRHRS